ncbi:hypothetical protein ABEKA_3255 [Acinetobacter lwoffii]|uniref:Qat anti-phage system associated protein QatB n=1 Tax=Acinetobacter lwoffii TaxID=28090 RepID=UPI001E4D751A|nr:Qat anti-phage system associated protein QatB [Acinetobacter lwoffii]QZD33511.1 hypothetical protein ABEKA_1523 [Acinetobacter lwoffii]QZD35160.1 hypothetical protein ABEKA_3255 [Acinetobacter lwoffii]
MGTSQSSKGSPSNVPTAPSWVAPNSPIAESGRFGPARRNIASFMVDGQSSSMRKGVGQYIKKGYGGSKTATSRMAGTVQKASTFFDALNPTTQAGAVIDPVLLAGKSADEIMDAIVEVVAPIDGTQDTESSRDSVKNALCELLEKFPNADLANLDDTQRIYALEKFVADDVFRRIYLDLGQIIQSKAPNMTIGLSRLKEIKDYVKETVAASFRKNTQNGIPLISNQIKSIVSTAIQETFSVFEDYAE